MNKDQMANTSNNLASNPVCPKTAHRLTTRPGKALTLAIVGVAGLAVIGGVTWWAMAKPAEGKSKVIGTLDLATASVIDFDVTTTATGELEAKNQIEIRNKLETPATIQNIIKEGENVKAGEILVQLNSEEIVRQLEDSQLAVESATADLANAENAYEIQLSENESALRKAKLGVDLADLDLKKWLEGEVVSKRQALDLALEKAEREISRLKDKFEQAVKLEERGFLSRDERQRDELAYLEAKAALETANLNKETYQRYEFPKDEKTKQSAVDDAKAELGRTLSKNNNQMTIKEADRVNKRQQVALRQQRLDKLKAQIANTVIKAPNDGLVVHATSMDRNRWGGDDGPLQIGKQVFPNQLLIVLPDTSEMVASVRVQESIAGKVKPGQNTSVKIDAVGGRVLRGTVVSVGVLAESGGWRDPNLREYTIKIALELPPEKLDVRPSMRCESEIVLDRVEKALTVPIQAVFSDGLVRYVHIAKDGKFTRKPVKLGRRSDRYAEIVTGVGEGEKVLVRKPQPGEVLDKKWEQIELAAVGLDLSPDGKVIPKGGKEGERRGGPARGPSAPAGSVGSAKPGEAGKKTTEVTPTATPEVVPAAPAGGAGGAGAPAATVPAGTPAVVVLAGKGAEKR